jgi:hypothetical protein
MSDDGMAEWMEQRIAVDPPPAAIQDKLRQLVAEHPEATTPAKLIGAAKKERAAMVVAIKSLEEEIQQLDPTPMPSFQVVQISVNNTQAVADWYIAHQGHAVREQSSGARCNHCKIELTIQRP